jgi:hypothetical protein
MPLATHDAESSGGFEQAVSLAGKIQIVNINMPNGNPTVGQTIATSGSWTSGLIFSDGYQILTVGVKMDRAGTLLITRYIDLAGQMARPVSSTSIVANTLLIVDITDNLPFVTYQIEIDNGAVGTATIAQFSALMNAN